MVVPITRSKNRTKFPSKRCRVCTQSRISGEIGASTPPNRIQLLVAYRSCFTQSTVSNALNLVLERQTILEATTQQQILLVIKACGTMDDQGEEEMQISNDKGSPHCSRQGAEDRGKRSFREHKNIPAKALGASVQWEMVQPRFQSQPMHQLLDAPSFIPRDAVGSPSRLSLDMIQQEEDRLPQILFKGAIVMVEQLSQAEDALKLIAHETIVGFDMEWKPNLLPGDNHPIALIQISGVSVCILFRINLLGCIPNSLVELLTSHSICKIGHTIDHNDAQKLEEQHGITLHNVIDIKEIAITKNLYPLGLKALTRSFLHCYLDKKHAVSDWEQQILSRAQIQYAATDAWVSRAIYLKMATRSEDEVKSNNLLKKWMKTTFDCPICNREFKDRCALRQHVRHKKHFEESNIQQPIMPISCGRVMKALQPFDLGSGRDCTLDTIVLVKCGENSNTMGFKRSAVLSRKPNHHRRTQHHNNRMHTFVEVRRDRREKC
ncbi:ribonuclease D [Planoprotostelium fungivorum]|uniref:Ribonuclease D n=1 Tax=Planoprotostelium fungivorum TaxID=1890364 RepID=A0A2P6MM61_9EUKA|nr:ribonuclease D [Planoprotostelium fungivorum]